MIERVVSFVLQSQLSPSVAVSVTVEFGQMGFAVAGVTSTASVQGRTVRKKVCDTGEVQWWCMSSTSIWMVCVPTSPGPGVPERRAVPVPVVVSVIHAGICTPWISRSSPKLTSGSTAVMA